VKVIILEVRDVSLIVRQRVAFVAAAPSVKELPAAFRCSINGISVAGDKVIEGRIKRQLCALVGCNGSKQVGAVRLSAEDASERLLVFSDGCDLGHGCVQAGLAHLNGIDDW
jgi:hypothetical protein